MVMLIAGVVGMVEIVLLAKLAVAMVDGYRTERLDRKLLKQSALQIGGNATVISAFGVVWLCFISPPENPNTATLAGAILALLVMFLLGALAIGFGMKREPPRS